MKYSNYCASINYAGLGNATRAAVFALLLGAALPLSAQTAAQGKTVQTFLIYYGGGPTLVAPHPAKLAEIGLLDFYRFRYKHIRSHTLGGIQKPQPPEERSPHHEPPQQRQHNKN